MTLPDDLRARAQQQREIANALIQEPDVLTTATKLVPCIVGHVNANVLEAFADSMEFQRATTGIDSTMQRRKVLLERNDAIRNAAARGDWAEFDRLTNGGGTGTAGGATA